MNKRDFIKKIGLTTMAVSAMPSLIFAKKDNSISSFDSKMRYWVWHNPDPNESEEAMKKRFSMYKNYGITGIFFEADHEQAFRIAKSFGLETHRWIWIMNRNDKTLMKDHPDWFTVSRKGENCVEKPPYVDYYRWVCPNKKEVQQYLKDLVTKEAAKDYVDGIHLDYIRFCDVILPVDLWKNYNLIQTQELPEFDFCYCETCRSKYKNLTGIDIKQVAYPSDSPSWLQFRFDSITNIVNMLSNEVKNIHKKKITAAVFPTPFIAKRNVRQDWVNWHLDGICPMIYHSFYKENTPWIETATKDGVEALKDTFPLYAGLYLPAFKDESDLETGIRHALKGGAKGISLFSSPDEKHLKTLQKVIQK